MIKPAIVSATEATAEDEHIEQACLAALVHAPLHASNRPLQLTCHDLQLSRRELMLGTVRTCR